MNTHRQRSVVVSFVTSILVLSPGWSRGEPAATGTAEAPRAEPQFKAGDTLTVAAERALVMRGVETVASVSRGQQVLVIEVRGPWIGIATVLQGQTKTGWIRPSDFIPAACTAQALAYTAYRPIEARPIAATATAIPASTLATPYASPVQSVRPLDPGANYLKQYETGYYQRKETDPNLHVWEPWRN